MDYIGLAIAILGGYLLGSVPFGLVLTKMAGLGDIRSVGSGNIGATNVLRTGRKDIAAATLLLDACKAGLAALLVGRFFGQDLGMIAGAAAFLGHCFPIWLGFKGGKGVATFFGTLIFGAPAVGVVSALIWLGVAFTFRFSSLAAIVAAILAPLFAKMLKMGDISVYAIIFMTVLIIIRHKDNITRLTKGTEPKIGKKKKDTTENNADEKE